MSLDNLKKIWLSAIGFLAAALICLFITETYMQSSLRGILLFAGDNGIVVPFSKIEVERDGKKITVYNDEGLWRVVEADNYYASFRLLNAIADNIAAAKIGAEYVEKDIEEKHWTKLSLFDNDNRCTASVMLADAEQPGLHLVRLADRPGVYRSTWKTQLPSDLSSWTRQPLLDFQGQEIASFKVGKSAISRREEGAAFYNEQTAYKHTNFDYMRIFNILNDLRYDTVRSVQNFDDSSYVNLHTMEYTTFNGLICRLRIYTDYSDYWASIDISMTTLPGNDVRHYVEHNSIFFKDWLFRLSADDGKSLFMFKL